MIKDREELIWLIKATSWFNGGMGVIVTPHMAKLLREDGITEGYSENKPILDTDIKEL